MENNTLQLAKYNLTINELWLLFSQHAPAVVIGIENPYAGWLAEEIEKSSRKAAASLEARGLLRPVSDDTADVDDDLMAMADACVHPRHSVILQISSRDGDGGQRYYKLTDKLIVEHHESSPGQYRLTEIPSRQVLVDHMIYLMNLDQASTGKGRSFQVPEDVLFKVSELAARGRSGEISILLGEAKVGKLAAQALQSAFEHLIANASIAVIANLGDPDTQYVSGFGILQSEDNIWVMTPFQKLGKPMVEFVPVNLETIPQKLHEIIPG